MNRKNMLIYLSLLLLTTLVYDATRLHAAEQLQTSTENKPPLIKNIRIPITARLFLLAGESLILSDNEKSVCSINLETGEKKWQLDTKNSSPTFGISSGDTAYIVIDGYQPQDMGFKAINLKTGKPIWSVSASGIGFSNFSPTRNILVSGNALLVTISDSLYAFDKNYGGTIWLIKYNYEQDKIVQQTQCQKEERLIPKLIYWGIGNKIIALNPESGKIFWQMNIEEVEEHVKKYGIADGDCGLGNEISQKKNDIVLFCFRARKTNNILFAVDVENRKKKWTFTAGRIYAFTQDGNKIFISSDSGVKCLNATNGNEKWSNPLERNMRSKIVSGCIVTDKVVYCYEVERKSIPINKANIYALDKVKGEILWKYPCEMDSENSLIFHSVKKDLTQESKLYVLCTEKDGNGTCHPIAVFDHEKTLGFLENK